MRRFIAVVLIFSVALAIVGTYVSRPPQTQSLVAGNCLPADAQAIQRAIIEQTQAMSSQDFQLARSYASNSFRSRISEMQFARIISQGYEILLQDPRVTFNSCEQVDDQLIRISATFNVDGETVELQYLMINESNGWFIDSASRPGDSALTA
jgi:hypothetical protein